MMSNRITIITPFYNPGPFLEQCVSSAISQNYDNYKIIYVDDMSTDGSYDKLPKDDERVVVIRNEVRKTALENLHNAIMNHCDPEDIVVILDGDDWFPNKKVLQYVNEQYQTQNCWIMYGQASWTDGRRGFASAYSAEEFANVRKAPFRVSHLRTFRAGLYQAMEKQDPDFSGLKDGGGDFYKSSYDTAIMFPIMEMAGHEKTLFNDTILYIYNRDNPISDDKVDQKLQWDVHKEVSNKKPLKRISDYNA
jgi:glycosyltransferase involved in cell wall biosynthesis